MSKCPLSLPECERLKYLRSRKQNGRFFVVIEEAYKHWSKQHGFQPGNEEHLRYWLEKEAGLFDVAMTYRPDAFTAEQIEALLVGLLKAIADRNRKLGVARDAVFIEEDERGSVVVKVTRSIAWLVLPQDDFNKLSGDVYEVLAVHGFDHNHLLEQKDKAA